MVASINIFNCSSCKKKKKKLWKSGNGAVWTKYAQKHLPGKCWAREALVSGWSEGFSNLKLPLPIATRPDPDVTVNTHTHSLNLLHPVVISMCLSGLNVRTVWKNRGICMLVLDWSSKIAFTKSFIFWYPDIEEGRNQLRTIQNK